VQFTNIFLYRRGFFYKTPFGYRFFYELFWPR
jgi:hypothetical protein